MRRTVPRKRPPNQMLELYPYLPPYLLHTSDVSRANETVEKWSGIHLHLLQQQRPTGTNITNVTHPCRQCPNSITTMDNTRVTGRNLPIIRFNLHGMLQNVQVQRRANQMQQMPTEISQNNMHRHIETCHHNNVPKGKEVHVQAMP